MLHFLIKIDLMLRYIISCNKNLARDYYNFDNSPLCITLNLSSRYTIYLFSTSLYSSSKKKNPSKQ